MTSLGFCLSKAIIFTLVVTLVHDLCRRTRHVLAFTLASDTTNEPAFYNDADKLRLKDDALLHTSKLN